MNRNHAQKDDQDGESKHIDRNRNIGGIDDFDPLETTIGRNQSKTIQQPVFPTGENV